MPQPTWIALKCKLSKGLFSSERAFEVTLANGEKHSGPAPRHFCWNTDGKPLGVSEATCGEVDGWVAARPLERNLEGDQIAVEVPDGEVIAVRQRETRAPWTPIQPPTPATA